MMGHAGVTPVQCRSRPLSLFKEWRNVAGWGLMLCVLFLSPGCTTPIHKRTAVSTIVIEPMTGTVEAKPAAFRLIGRVSVTGGKDSFSGGVQWHHVDTSDEILLLSPLGQAVAQIQRNPEGVYLTTSEQETFYAFDVETLTERVLGWRLPLMGLQYWVQSVNSPATVAEVDRDIDGTIVAMRQDGWEISYLSHFPVPETQTKQAQAARPKLLMLKRPGLQIKLMVDSWNPGNQ
ncbi:lipoprotein insertase outer membrane protein LolB [Nitrosospira sp. Nsp13]|uniref:lipoprotein insertase outer membrane protein LolB n=1 Tax=Nitrosospira sp. Nsp13 TaxID=1855332 RepID=UPI00087E7E46|nr:lipoprotein insertase outer membrane protein LolB [Nitrosospira sp. Nsp13]SCY17807.1 outer membrane lipoprotein LolB [Nitrosospira sp. Nsp13]